MEPNSAYSFVSGLSLNNARESQPNQQFGFRGFLIIIIIIARWYSMLGTYDMLISFIYVIVSYTFLYVPFSTIKNGRKEEGGEDP